VVVPLSSKSDVIIYHSLLRPATTDDNNVYTRMSGEESSIPTGPIKDRSSIDESKPASTPTDKAEADIPPPSIIHSEGLIGHSFLMDEQEDGQKFRATNISLLVQNLGREGHILIISRALYGLRSSGARWHDQFADCIREIGVFPCKAEPDIWMRKRGSLYVYIALYVDDLAIAMKSPKELTDILEKQHKFKLKGTGPISLHLRMDFIRDEDNTLCISPTK
jgi:Reverse transcriptase (RNA-dependent DNA polymerase)